MCCNVRVRMVVLSHMLVPNVGQINIDHHHANTHRSSSSSSVVRCRFSARCTRVRAHQHCYTAGIPAPVRPVTQSSVAHHTLTRGRGCQVVCAERDEGWLCERCVEQ